MNLFRAQMDALKRLGYATINKQDEPKQAEVVKRAKGSKRKGA